MPRRNRPRRRQARTSFYAPEPPPPNYDEVARGLVRDGKASRSVLGPIPPRWLDAIETPEGATP